MSIKTIAALAIAAILSTGVTAAVPDGNEQTSNTSVSTPGPSDQEIRQLIIQQSIQSYSGNCPCPYNRASNGSRCGGRSAYSRAGGQSPLCYEQDISEEMVRRYTGRNR